MKFSAMFKKLTSKNKKIIITPPPKFYIAGRLYKFKKELLRELYNITNHDDSLNIRDKEYILSFINEKPKKLTRIDTEKDGRYSLVFSECNLRFSVISNGSDGIFEEYKRYIQEEMEL